MKTAFEFNRRCSPPRQGQRGITLIIALLVLVAMTMAGLALVRSVDTATLMAGNLAFRQSAAASADNGMETAIGTLRGMTPSALQTDSTGNGYYAELPATSVDFTGNATPTSATDDFDWSTANTVSTADATGNTVSYVIHRLCSSSGALDPTKCTTWQENSVPVGSQGIVTADETYRDPTLTGTVSAIHGVYRITVRISGPRNTVSYVQAIVIV